MTGAPIFSGEDALSEVGKDDGRWNWALVGPDPERLPLAGGGAKSIEEMRGVFGKQAHCFGLLRMSFGVDNPETRFLYIHASDDIDSGNFSSVERGKAVAMEPKMEEAIRKFASFSAKIRLHSVEECTVESLVDKLRSVVRGVDTEILTVENFRAAVEAEKAQHPEEQQKEQQEEKKQEFLEKIQAPTSEVATAEPDMQPAEVEEAGRSSRQRKRIKLWTKGDCVEVYSVKHQKWFNDAEIVEVVTETCVREGYRVNAGSMKVVYENGTRFKWVAAQEMDQFLRPSNRPKPVQPRLGDLMKETYWLFVPRWNKLYVEMHKGFLQWWNTREEAQKRAKPQGSIYLLGLELQLEGTTFKLRSDSTQGALFTFQAMSEEEAKKWVDDLWLQAEYCSEMLEFHQAQQGGQQMRKELLNVMMRKELKSKIPKLPGTSD